MALHEVTITKGVIHLWTGTEGGLWVHRFTRHCIPEDALGKRRTRPAPPSAVVAPRAHHRGTRRGPPLRRPQLRADHSAGAVLPVAGACVGRRPCGGCAVRGGGWAGGSNNARLRTAAAGAPGGHRGEAEDRGRGFLCAVPRQRRALVWLLLQPFNVMYFALHGTRRNSLRLLSCVRVRTRGFPC